MLDAPETDNSDIGLRIPRFSTGYMNPSVDSRKDFYEYAVGEWIKNNPVPKDKTRWGAFNEVHERNLVLLREILEESASDLTAAPRSPKRLVGEFYRSVMDTKRIEKIRFKPIQALLEQINSTEKGESLGRCLAQLQNFGVNALFASYSAADKKNSSVYALYIEQGGLSLPDRDYYLRDSFAEIREAYRIHLVRMFSLAGESEEEGKRLAEIVFSLETEMAKASRSRVDLRDEEKNYNRIETASLNAKFSSMHLRTFLEASLVPSTEFVVMGQPEFFESIDRLISERPITDLRVYLRWHLLHAFATLLHSAVDAEDFDFFHKKLRGQPEPEERWKRAVHATDGLLGEALGKLYVEKHFPPEAMTRAVLMVDDIRDVFKERLANLPWMTEPTRKQALAKFFRFRAKIGHPKVFRDYSSINIDMTDCIGNVCRAAEFEAHRQANRVGKPVDKEEWLATPPTINAYFHPMENTINFPAGILQPPFFDVALDDAVNYGGIGGVIAHEITHGYDDQGRRFDAEGNLRDWWSPEDENRFQARAKEIMELYGALEPLPGLPVNGELTLGENIADFGGVSIAYEALKRRLEKEPGKRKMVDGFTPEQRFFIAWAQIWRQNIREEELRRLLTMDPHAPARYRAVLPAINDQDFDLAFPPNIEEQVKEKKHLGVW